MANSNLIGGIGYCLPQDSEFLVVAAVGSPRIFRSLAFDSFVVQKSMSLAQNLLPKISTIKNN